MAMSRRWNGDMEVSQTAYICVARMCRDLPICKANELAPSRDAGVERRAGTLTSQAIITHLYRIVYVIIHPSIITHRPIHIHKWATSRAFYSHISLHISQDFSPSCRQGFALPASIVLATPP